MIAVIQFKSAFAYFADPGSQSAFRPESVGRPVPRFRSGPVRAITAKEMRNRAFRPWTQSDLLGPIGSYWDQKMSKCGQQFLVLFGLVWCCLVLFGPKKMLRAFVPIRVQIQNDELS